MDTPPVRDDSSNPASRYRHSAPVSVAERVHELDVLRGVALYGVFLMNMLGFAGKELMATEQQMGRIAFDRGEYRWAATLLNHLVFATPSNKDAKELLASTYEQLGYQAESGPWRDVYLTGAFELRNGTQCMANDPANAMGLLRATPAARSLDSMAVRLNGPDADGKHMSFNFIFDDVQESHVVELEQAAVIPVPDRQARRPVRDRYAVRVS